MHFLFWWENIEIGQFEINFKLSVSSHVFPFLVGKY